MSARRDGGPAFPQQELNQGGTPNEHLHRGLTVRDYAEIEFTKAWVVALSARHEEPGYDDDGVVGAARHLGKVQAEAFLAERGLAP